MLRRGSWERNSRFRESNQSRRARARCLVQCGHRRPATAKLEAARVLQAFGFDPDPSSGTPFIDPSNAHNIVVPATDGTTIVIDLDDYLTDANGDALVIIPDTLPAGAVFDQATNTLTLTPPSDNAGDIVVPFTVNDGNGGTISPTVTIRPVNPAPVALNDIANTDFETPVVISPLDNDTDPDSDSLIVSAIAGVPLTTGIAQTITVANATVLVGVDGSITVVPDNGFSGDITVPYTLTDVDGANATAIQTVTVANATPVVTDPDTTPGTPFIDPLVADQIVIPAVDGIAVTIDLDDYLSDPNGDPVTIIPGILPPGATFNVLTRELTFIPPVDNNGDTSVSFTVTDSNGATINPTVLIQPVNPLPDAADQLVTTNFETPVVIAPLANDFDPDGDALTLIEIASVAVTPGTEQTIAVPNGILTLATDGSITLTPDTGFSGYIPIPYSIADADGATDSAVHTVVIGNVPPTLIDPDPSAGTPFINPFNASDLVVPAVDGIPLSINLNDYFIDPNGDAFTITPGVLPDGVTYDPLSHQLSALPPTDNNGTLAFPVTLTDSQGHSSTATVSIVPVNPVPLATDDLLTTAFETPIAFNPLANDADPDADPIALEQIAGVTVTPGIQQTIPVSNGFIVVNTDGTVIVTPADGFSGDIIIPYVIADADGTSNTATITISVENAPPELIDPDPSPGTPYLDPDFPDNILVPATDGVAVTIDLDEYLYDPNGDPLTITPGSLPPGAVYDPVTRQLTFIPLVDNTGATHIPFNVDDGQGGSITITIQPVNPAPVAIDDNVTTPPDTPVTISPLSNDTDPDGDVIVIAQIAGVTLTPGTEQSITIPGGTVFIATDGTITVTPDTGFAGEIEIPYVITDDDGQSDAAIYTVTVENAQPQVIAATSGTDRPIIDPVNEENIIVPAVDGEAVTIDLDDCLTDRNGDSLTITAEDLPPQASFNPATNELTFVPAIDNNGNTVLPIKVADGKGGEINPTITIAPVNPAPVANADSTSTDYGTPVLVDLIANDTDPDNDPLSLFEPPALLNPLSGTLEQIEGDWIFTPAPGYSGEAVISYLLQDQDGAVDASTHTVLVGEPVPSITELGEARGVTNSYLPLVEKPQAPEEEKEKRIPFVPAVHRESPLQSMIEQLNPMSGTALSIDGAVLQSIEDINSLNHIGVDNPEQQGKLTDTLADGLGKTDTYTRNNDSYLEATGFSSGKGYRGTFSIDPTDECGRFFIDTIVRDGMLSVTARSTIDPQRSNAVTRFSMNLADGKPLPPWVVKISDGEYLIKSDTGLESLVLKVVAHREKGSPLVRVVEVDTLTGQIEEKQLVKSPRTNIYRTPANAAR